MQGFDDIPEIALKWHRAGRGAALATVVETWGSAPRPVGSQLAISGAGEMAGSVSGGCVEGAVVTRAQELIGTGKSEILDFGVADDDAFAVGLACGGRIKVMVEPVGAGGLEAPMLADLIAARAARRAVAYCVDIITWRRRLCDASTPALAARFRADKSGFDGAQFIGLHNPPLRLAVVGAVHIAQPLTAMARLAGFDVTVIDPRQRFITPERFPDVRLSPDWPDVALSQLGLDARAGVVTLSHDPKIDDPAIRAALASEAFYIGCLGAMRTHAKRIERLTATGHSRDDLARLHAPVGLDIGAQSPAEIALSVLAQITLTLRGTRRGGAGALPS